MIFKALPNEAAGCIGYLIGCEKAGVAAIVDPSRADVDEYGAQARARGPTVTHVIDTHIHADHVSGNRELAGRTGGAVCLHEEAEVRFSPLGLQDGPSIRLGSVELRVLHTPGHTPENMCLVVTDTARGPEPCFALTGDTLFVGNAGRPDFGGETAAAALHRSLFERLLPLGNAVEVYPPTAPARAAGARCRPSSAPPSASSGDSTRTPSCARSCRACRRAPPTWTR
jgi:hydroxyacylglutathione hydrolase